MDAIKGTITLGNGASQSGDFSSTGSFGDISSNLFDVYGLGVVNVVSPTDHPIAVVSLLKVPWSRADTMVSITTTLLDEAGQPVSLRTAEDEQAELVTYDASIIPMKEYAVAPGCPMLLNHYWLLEDGLWFPEPGQYTWELRADNELLDSHPMRVTAA